MQKTVQKNSVQKNKKIDKKVLTFITSYGIIRMYQETSENNIYVLYIN